MITSNHPFPQFYWVRPNLFCGSQYPGDLNPETRDEKLRGLVRCGIRRIINLIPAGETGAGGVSFEPYEGRLAKVCRAESWSIHCMRLGFPDAGVPSVELMVTILDVVDTSIAATEPVCIHCWGGHGRTGTVAACQLIRHGLEPEDAIQRIIDLRQNLPKRHDPFEGEQKKFIRAWKTGQ